MYYDYEGNELSKDEIVKAVEEHRAVLCWSHGEWENVASLIICDNEEDAETQANVDTVGDCYSMWDEVWSDYPESIDEALRAAAG